MTSTNPIQKKQPQLILQLNDETNSQTAVIMSFDFHTQLATAFKQVKFCTLTSRTTTVQSADVDRDQILWSYPGQISLKSMHRYKVMHI